MNKNKTPKQIWKRALKLAREPDRFLADELVIDFPVHYLLYALKVTNFKIEEGLGFKTFIKEISK